MSKWIDAREQCGSFVCPKCEYQSKSQYNFCPECGRDMRDDGYFVEMCPECDGVVKVTDELESYRYCPYCGCEWLKQEVSENAGTD